MTILSETARPLGVVTAELSDAQVTMLRRIEEFDLWFVIEKLCIDGTLPAANVPAAVLEFKRYIALVALGDKDLPVSNHEVDDVWHAFILFTREYSMFCEQVIGRFIHHAPFTSRSPSSPPNSEALVAAYYRMFGKNRMLLESGPVDSAHCNSGSCRSLSIHD